MTTEQHVHTEHRNHLIKDFTSEIKQTDPVTIEMKVDIAWKDVSDALENKFAEAQKVVKIKGFRPGKVPRHVVKQQFSKEVYADTLEAVVSDTLFMGIDKHAVPVVAPARFKELPKIENGKDLSYTAVIEVRPTIDKINLDGLELNQKKISVTDKDVENNLLRIQKNLAQVKTVEEARAVKAEDVAVISSTLEADGVNQDKLSTDEIKIDLGEENILADLKDGLLGMKVGETKKIELKDTDPFEELGLKGKKVFYVVTLKSIEERILPAIDDDMAKDYGAFENLEALKTKIKEDMARQAESQNQSSLRAQVIEKLTAANPVMVPKAYVQSQFEDNLKQYVQIMKWSKQTPDLSTENTDRMLKSAEERVRAGILLSAYGKLENIKVEASELEKRFQEMADATGKNIAKIRAEHQGDARDELQSELLEKKIIDSLIAKAKINWVE